MTDQLRQILSANLKSARESGDTKRIAEAAQAMDDALAECQAHTADRVKRIEARVEKMDGTLDSINTQMTDVATSRAVLTEKYDATTQGLNEVKLEIRDWKNRAKGAGWGVRAAIAVGSVIGFETLKNLFEAITKLGGGS